MTLHLFEGYGIELEYMIVDRRDGAVRPLCDALLEVAEGQPANDHEDGAIAWSNELVRHVVELKTNGPAPSLSGLAAEFQRSLGRIHDLLAPWGARIQGGGMHPTFDPATETHLWQQDYSEVYAAYDRIFGCKGHGWSNLQSMHINLPFADDAEFARLHAAIRVVLPMIPALSASSPFQDGRAMGVLDQRLRVYRTNSARVPSMTGRVVPEPCSSQAQFQREVLDVIHADLAPLDPEGVLHGEWTNARGAIPRFDRGAIEIRVIDVQECPRADLAVAAAVVALVRALTEQRWCPSADLDALPTQDLADLLWQVVEHGERASVEHPALLAALGRRPLPVTAGALWAELVEELLPRDDPAAAEFRPALEVILERGPLARRLLQAAGDRPDRARLRRLGSHLTDRARDGQLFTAEDFRRELERGSTRSAWDGEPRRDPDAGRSPRP